MKPFPRTRRIADQIQRELAGIIHAELKDPRVGMVTITEVEVSPDYAHAKIFVTVLGPAAQNGACIKALQHASGFLRSELSRRLGLRAVPQLHFIYDESVERGVHLSHLIETAVRQQDRD